MQHDFVESIFRFLSDMEYRQLAALGGAAAATYAVYRRYTRISLDDVPGPENPSFLHGKLHSDSLRLPFGSTCMWGTWGVAGHQPFLQDAEAGELENNYLSTYGSIVHWKGPLGVCGLLKPNIHSSPIVVLTGGAHRKTVCGSPTPRLFPISFTETYGSELSPIARSMRFCSIGVCCGQKGMLTSDSGKR